MFTGIVSDIGEVLEASGEAPRRLVIACGYRAEEIALGASIACSGVCLTVTDKGTAPGSRARAWFAAEVSAETLARTTLSNWQVGTRINLERSLKVGDELGGHIVTGHVDATGEIRAIAAETNAHRVMIAAPRSLAPLIAEKGSIAVDGISLTVNRVKDDAQECRFEVNIVPHTLSHTTMGDRRPGDSVNLEIDVLARYIARWQAQHLG
ncbi:MAG: riboflavin synthase [Alphaproteobacteria bacterium]|nr:MAG: riboflavin synthase [Alphaproteobacteria bacterium]